MTNDELSKMVDTSDEWIVQRSGIRERHIAADDETTFSMALIAAKRALEDAGMTADDIDLVICATSSSEVVLPAAAAFIQAELGITQGAAFDVKAVCAGFVFGLTTADKFLKTGCHKRALVIGTEIVSRVLDWTDRVTCVLFGDGAGAAIVEAQEESVAGDRGILATSLRTDGRHFTKIHCDGGTGSLKPQGYLHLDGREVFKFAVWSTADVVEDVFRQTGYTADDLDWFVPHQANQRIIMGGAKELGIAAEKVVMTVDKHGNTSAASVPLALDVAIKDGRIKKGDLVLLEALGGGFAWGSLLVRW